MRFVTSVAALVVAALLAVGGAGARTQTNWNGITAEWGYSLDLRGYIAVG